MNCAILGSIQNVKALVSIFFLTIFFLAWSQFALAISQGDHIQLTQQRTVRSGAAGVDLCNPFTQPIGAIGRVREAPQNAVLNGTNFQWVNVEFEAGECNGWIAFMRISDFQTYANILTPPLPGGLTPGATTSPGPEQNATTSIQLSWANQPRIAYYSGSITNDVSGAISNFTTSVNVSATIASSLQVGNRYRWQVRACYSSANCSALTSPVYFRTAVVPIITSIDPNPVFGSPAEQNIQIYGTGFGQSTPVISLENLTSGATGSGFPISWNDVGITARVSVGTVTSNWRIKVRNGANQQDSAWLNFPVVATQPQNTPPSLVFNPTTANGISYVASTTNTATASLQVTPNGGSGSGTDATTTFNNCIVENDSLASFIAPQANLQFQPNTSSQSVSLTCNRKLPVSTATLACIESRAGTNQPTIRWQLNCPAQQSTSAAPTLSLNPTAGSSIQFTGGNGSIQVTPNGDGSGTGALATTTFGSCSFSGASASAFTTTNASFSFVAATTTLQSAQFACSRGSNIQSANLTCIVNLGGQAVNPSPTWPVICPALTPIEPTISSVSPNPVIGANQSQSITINGANFVDRPRIILTWTGQSGYELTSSQITFVSASQLRMLINTTNAPDQWTVRAVNPNGASSNAQSFSVTSPSAQLGTPTLNLPANHAGSVSITPNFQWNLVPGANRYWLTVAAFPNQLPVNPNSSSCAACLISGNTDALNYTPPVPFTHSGRTVTLSPGTIYYWRVQAFTQSGSSVTQQGQFSEIRSFSTAAATPGQKPLTPTAISPNSGNAPGIVTPSREVNFTWQPQTGSPKAGWFDFQVYRASNNQLEHSNPTQTGSSKTVLLLNSVAYYWKIAACNAAGCSLPTQPAYFTTPTASTQTPTTPIAVTGDSISPGQPIGSLQPSLNWQSSANTTYHRIELMRNNVPIQGSPFTSTSSPWTTPILQNSEPYSWQVMSCNTETSCSSYSNPKYFISGGGSTGALSSPTNLVPFGPSQNNPLQVGLNVNFSWQQVSGAQVYLVSVYDILAKRYLREDVGTSINEISLSLPNGKTIWWQVLACRNGLCSTSEKSYLKVNASDARIPRDLTPGSVVAPGLRISGAGNSASTRLNWRGGSPAYRLEYRAGEFTQTSLVVANTSAFVDLNINGDQEYRWRVSGCITDSNPSTENCPFQSKWSYFHDREHWQSQPEPLRVEPIPLPSGTQKNLVVVTHGYASNAQGWPREIISQICDELSATLIELPSFSNSAFPSHYCQSQGWMVVAYDYKVYASLLSNGLPWPVLANSKSIGDSLASTIPPQIKHLHLIGHSAGSGFVQTLGAKFKAQGQGRSTHMTFLDAFAPSDNAALYGFGADFAEQYVDDGCLIRTQENLVNAKNIFVERLDARDRTEGVCEWVGGLSKEGIRQHGFPHEQYRVSVGISSIPGYLVHKSMSDFPISGVAPDRTVAFGGPLAAWWQPNANAIGFDAGAWTRSLKSKFGYGRVDLHPNYIYFGSTNFSVLAAQNFSSAALLSSINQQTACGAGGYANSTVSVISCSNPQIGGKPIPARSLSAQTGMTQIDVDVLERAHQMEYEYRFAQGTDGTLQIFLGDKLLAVHNQEGSSTTWQATGLFDTPEFLPGPTRLHAVIRNQNSASVTTAEIRNIRFYRVREINEEIFRTSFESGEATANPPSDIILDSAEVLSNAIAINEQQTVRVTARNAGAGLAEESLIVVRWSESASLPCTGPIAGAVELEQLAPSESITVSTNLLSPSVAGRYYACFSADHERVLTQLSLANDFANSDAFTVSPLPTQGYGINLAVGGLSSQVATASLSVGAPPSQIETLSVQNGTTRFASSIPSGMNYAITFSAPQGVLCTPASTSGTIQSQDISVNISCNATPNYTISGTIIGNSTTPLSLRLLVNNQPRPDISFAGPGFNFADQLTATTLWRVEVASQPAGLNCLAANNTGTITNANVSNVQVSCSAAAQFSVGGAVVGLPVSGNANEQVFLGLRAGSPLALVSDGPRSNGAFSFPTLLTSGSQYQVFVASQPSDYRCQTDGTASGTILSSNVTNVLVSCVRNLYSVGGLIEGLIPGRAVRLMLNNQVAAEFTQSEQYTFPQGLLSGTPYMVTKVADPPGQSCTLANSSGQIALLNIFDVRVTCTSNSYQLGGTISGLTGGSVVLSLNGVLAGQFSQNGSFVLQQVSSGQNYDVTIRSQPDAQNCRLLNGAGNVVANDISNLQVECSLLVWNALGAGVTSSNGRVFDIFVDGSDVYVGGVFSQVGGISANNIAKWDGSNWSALGSGLEGGVTAIAKAGGSIFAAGSLSSAPASALGQVLRWTGSQWVAVGAVAANQSISKLASANNDLYVAGQFTAINSVPANYVAKLDTSTGVWSSLGDGVLGSVLALEVAQGSVYVGGGFASAGGIPVNAIAKWDIASQTWGALGNGIGPGGISVIKLVGNRLWVGGYFNSSGTQQINKLAIWDGVSWSSAQLLFANDPTVHVDDIDARGNEIFVTGAFVGQGSSMLRVARFSNSWQSLGQGVEDGLNDFGQAIAVTNDEVFVGGSFTSAGTTSASKIARWGVNRSVRAPVLSFSSPPDSTIVFAGGTRSLTVTPLNGSGSGSAATTSFGPCSYSMNASVVSPFVASNISLSFLPGSTAQSTTLSCSPANGGLGGNLTCLETRGTDAPVAHRWVAYCPKAGAEGTPWRPLNGPGTNNTSGVWSDQAGTIYAARRAGGIFKYFESPAEWQRVDAPIAIAGETISRSCPDGGRARVVDQIGVCQRSCCGTDVLVTTHHFTQFSC